MSGRANKRLLRRRQTVQIEIGIAIGTEKEIAFGHEKLVSIDWLDGPIRFEMNKQSTASEKTLSIAISIWTKNSPSHVLQGRPLLHFQLLADTVLLLHFGIVIFVVLGLPVILLGNRVGWFWVNNLWWRLAHLMTIAVVVLQAWLGRYCSLTTLESSLREQAGQTGYERSFIEHWVQRILYVDAPMWVFALVYTVFAMLVAWAWWRFPPRVGRGKNGDA